MKKRPRINRRQRPGPDYQYTLADLHRMAEQLGMRVRIEMRPKALDERTEQPSSADAVPGPAEPIPV
jgi:hypothetical protein